MHELTKGVVTMQVVGFLRALRPPPKIKTGRHEIDQKRCLEVVLKHRKSRQIKSYLFSEKINEGNLHEICVNSHGMIHIYNPSLK